MCNIVGEFVCKVTHNRADEQDRPSLVWFGLYTCPDKPKPIIKYVYGDDRAKEKVVREATEIEILRQTAVLCQ